MKPFALVSIITDNFIGLGATWLASVTEHLRNIENTDIILLCAPSVAPLSEENRALLRSIHPGIIFREVSDGHLNEDATARYRHGRLVKTGIDAIVPAKRAVYLKLNLLTITGYKRIVWMDSDMLVLSDFHELFNIPAKIGAVSVGDAPDIIGLYYRKKGGFNSGLMVLHPDFTGVAWFDRALSILYSRVDTTFQDQSVFNELFRNENKLFLPHAYNWKTSGDQFDDRWDSALDKAKVVHFIGGIKWRLLEETDSRLSRAFHAVRERHGIPLSIEG